MATLQNTIVYLGLSFLVFSNQPSMVMTESFGQVYIWPLNNSTYGGEVYANTVQDNSQSGFKFGELHPNFNGVKSLTFDGSGYVDIAVGPASFGSNDVSLVIHFKKTNSADSTLFHYKSTATTGQITELKASVINEALVLSKTAYGSVEGKQFFASVKLNTWHTLIFCVLKSNGRYDVYLDNSNSVYSTDSFASDQTLTTPGTIRLGASLNGGDKFTGAVICMGLFNDDLESDDLTSIRSFCDKSNWVYTPTDLPSSLTTTLTSTISPTTTTSTTTLTSTASPITTTSTTTTTPTSTTSPTTTTSTTTTTPTSTTSPTATTSTTTTTPTSTTSPTTTTSTTTTTPTSTISPTTTTPTTTTTSTSTTSPTTTTSTTTTTPTSTTSPTTTTSTTSTTTSPTTTTTSTNNPIKTIMSPSTSVGSVRVCQDINCYIERVADQRKPTTAIESPYDLLIVTSILRCAGRCGRNVTCSSFTFNVSNKTCGLYTQSHSAIDLMFAVEEIYFKVI